jgi:hypothetical protein
MRDSRVKPSLHFRFESSFPMLWLKETHSRALTKLPANGKVGVADSMDRQRGQQMFCARLSEPAGLEHFTPEGWDFMGF